MKEESENEVDGMNANKAEKKKSPSPPKTPNLTEINVVPSNEVSIMDDPRNYGIGVEDLWAFEDNLVEQPSRPIPP